MEGMFTFIGNVFGFLSNDFLTALDDFVGGNFTAFFMFERIHVGMFGENPFTTNSINQMYLVLYGALLTLLTAKFLWKGTKVYIFGRDGDAEEDPKKKLVGIALALATAVAFPLLYEVTVLFATQLIGLLAEAMGATNNEFDYYLYYGEEARNIFAMALDDIRYLMGAITMRVVFSIPYLIGCTIVTFRIFGLSLELMVWRLGLPLATVGLLDSDGGVFKPYMQSLFRSLASIVVMLMLMQAAGRFYSMQIFAGYFMAMVCIVAALTAPRTLSQFMTPGAGSHISQQLHTALLITNSFRRSGRRNEQNKQPNQSR